LAALALANVVFGVLPGVVADDYPNRFAAWATLVGRLPGSVMLAAAAFAPPLRFERPRHAAVLMAGASIVSLAVIGEAIGLPLGLADVAGRSAALALHLTLVTVL